MNRLCISLNSRVARRVRDLMIACTVLCGFLTGMAEAASLKPIARFGANPSHLKMYLYVPDRLPSKSAVLVANHYCTGSGPAMFAGTRFAALADQFGFIVLYPSSTHSDHCFDVATPAALTRGGPSDPKGIRSMVAYVQKHYSVDSQRIFVTGISSGAMMTNVLLALYPDVFSAGAAFAGVPYGCFATGNRSRWSEPCAKGQITKTPAEWGDAVRAAFPGYAGPRPRVQLWHGTADEILSYVNFNEAIKTWTNLLGIPSVPLTTNTTPVGYTRTRYGLDSAHPQVEAISMPGVPHNLPIDAAEAIHFFGLDAAQEGAK